VEAARVAQVDNHCCSKAQVFTNTTCLLNKTSPVINSIEILHIWSWQVAHLPSNKL